MCARCENVLPSLPPACWQSRARTRGCWAEKCPSDWEGAKSASRRLLHDAARVAASHTHHCGVRISATPQRDVCHAADSSAACAAVGARIRMRAGQTPSLRTHSMHCGHCTAAACSIPAVESPHRLQASGPSRACARRCARGRAGSASGWRGVENALSRSRGSFKRECNGSPHAQAWSMRGSKGVHT